MVAWGKKLGGDRRFSSLTVLGHSEGSLIGMVAAQRMDAHAYVSIAGGGRPLQQIILEQVKSQLPDLLKPTQDILEQLAAGKRVESVPPALNAPDYLKLELVIIGGKLFMRQAGASERSEVVKVGDNIFSAGGQEFVLISETNGRIKYLHLAGHALRRM